MTELYKIYLTDPQKRDRVYRILFQLFLLFYVPLLSKPANILWTIFIVFWLTEPGLWGKVKAAFRNKVFLAVIMVYAMHVISLLYSADLYDGIKRLETRLGLFVFPLVLGTITLSGETVKAILKTFIWACAAVAVMGLAYSVYLYMDTGESVYLYSDNLLILIDGQAIYFSLYLNVAILFILFLMVRKELKRVEKKLMMFVLTPFFTVMIFLLAGRISLAILALLLVIVVATIIVKKRMYLAGAAIVAAVVAGALVMSWYFPKTINRFEALTNLEFDYAAPAEVYHFNDEEYKNKWNGLTIRLALWTCTWELIKERPVFGTGIGDFMSELREKYHEKNFQLALDWNLSPHNLFLQVWLALGLIGLALFVISILYPARHAFRTGNNLYLFFLLIVSLNMLTEEIFAVYRGVVFFSFLHSLLLFHPIGYRRDTF